MADETKAGETPAKQTVYVRSIPRPQWGGSYRLKRFWPSSDFTPFEGTAAEIAELRECPLLMVFDQRPSEFGATPPAGAAPALPQQPGAPPGSPPPPEAVHQQGLGDAAPHDALGVAGDRGGRSGARR